MQAYREVKKEIKTIQDLWKYSFYGDDENFERGVRENVIYVDVSPPLDEAAPKHLHNFEYWKRGKKQDYERKLYCIKRKSK